MEKREAQERADRIQAFRLELEALEKEGALRLPPEERARLAAHHDALLRDLSERFEVDTTAAERQLSWGMRIASLLAALALGAAVFFLFYRVSGLLATPVQVAVLAAAPLLGLAGTALAARRDRSGYFTALAGALAFACFLLDLLVLGTIFDLAPSQGVFLACAAFALLLAYACGLRILLVAGIGCLLLWLPATFGSCLGCAPFHFGLRPENFVLGGLVLFAVPLALRHRTRPGFPPLYRFFGLLALFVAVLILSYAGLLSYLPWGRSAVEGTYQVLGFLLCALAIGAGVRLGWRETANTGIAFFVVQLYAKFFDWWWEVMPRYAFFLVLGLTGVAVLIVLRWLREWKRRVQG